MRRIRIERDAGIDRVGYQSIDDLVAAIQPRRMTVVGDFSVRGGMKTVVTASYEKSEPETHA